MLRVGDSGWKYYSFVESHNDIPQWLPKPVHLPWEAKGSATRAMI